jgi:hypothetical protein
MNTIYIYIDGGSDCVAMCYTRQAPTQDQWDSWSGGELEILKVECDADCRLTVFTPDGSGLWSIVKELDI